MTAAAAANAWENPCDMHFGDTDTADRQPLMLDALIPRELHAGPSGTRYGV
jgi:hypothetical protein